MNGSLRKQITRKLILVFLAISSVFSITLFSFENHRYRQSLQSIETILNALVQNKVNSLGNMLFFRNTVGMESSLKGILEFHGILATEIYNAEGKLFFCQLRDGTG